MQPRRTRQCPSPAPPNVDEFFRVLVSSGRVPGFHSRLMEHNKPRATRTTKANQSPRLCSTLRKTVAIIFRKFDRLAVAGAFGPFTTGSGPDRGPSEARVSKRRRGCSRSDAITQRWNSATLDHQPEIEQRRAATAQHNYLGSPIRNSLKSGGMAS